MELALAVPVNDLPVVTTHVDAEWGERPRASAVPGAACFDGADWPILSAEAMGEVVSHYQTTLALTGAERGRLTPTQRRRLAEHRARADHYTAALVGSVFRLLAGILAHDLNENGVRLNAAEREDALAAGYAAVLAAARQYDPAHDTSPVTWLSQWAARAMRAERQTARLSGRLSPVERRVLRALQWHESRLVATLGRRPTREEVVDAVRATRVAAAVEAAGGDAVKARAAMVRSGEWGLLSRRDRLDVLWPLLSSVDVHLGDGGEETEVLDRLGYATSGAERPETEPLAALVRAASTFTGAATHQRIERALADEEIELGRGERRALAGALSAPHLQYFVLAAGVEERWRDAPSTTERVRTRARARAR